MPSESPPSPGKVSQYANILIALQCIPSLYNILAIFFTWILLAAFVTFPATFTKIQNARGNAEVGDLQGGDVVGEKVLQTARHVIDAFIHVPL